MFYEIPVSLPGEIDELESLIAKYRAGALDAASLKARRVPFGCYEQRKDGTYMVRARTAGGALTPAQLRAIAVVCDRYGSNEIHITTRQEFQVHDVALENVITVMRELLTAGLATRGGGGNTVRNIMVSPDAGVSPEEVFDPSPYAFALTSRLISEPDSWVLPRKFKITFSNSDKDTAYAQFNDLGFVAKIKDGVKGFKVYVAGGMGTKPAVGHLLHEFIPAGDTYIVAEAAKRVFDQHGNRKNKYAARLRFLWNSLGEARFRELYQNELDKLRLQNPPPFPVNEELAPLATPSLVQVEVATPEFDIWKRRYVTAQRQPGLSSILIPVFLGNLKTKDAIALAELFGRVSALTSCVPRWARTFVSAISRKPIWGMSTSSSAISQSSPQPHHCSPIPLPVPVPTLVNLASACPKAHCEPSNASWRNSGLDLDQLAGFKINLSGCPNTCGQHMVSDLGFYGMVGRKGQLMYPAYGIVAGAVLADGTARLATIIDRVSSRDLPDFVVDLLRIYLEKKSGFASFDAYIDTEGAQDIRSICNRYRDVPEFEADKNYYYDWGAEEVFSLVGRGVGECSAGLFDLIEVDLKQMDDLEQKLSNGVSGDERDNALYQLTLSSARMLLVTRAIEAPTDAAVFASFSKHFIEAGLVDARFQGVITAAQSGDMSGLRTGETEIHALAQEIKKLYASMDNSLRFPAETSKATAPPAPVPVERDYRGVKCPMNFVKVKLNLSKMQTGQRLRVLLDDGAPIENVPRSVVEEGHKVLEQTRVGDHWAVLIEKS